ncbi:HAD family hydrolase [Sulfidibacter corallicola]
MAHRRGWVFDMDGTLTHAIHDFVAIKRELGLPEDRPILEVLSEMDAARAAPIARRLDEIEYEIAGRATAAIGAVSLLRALRDAGAHLGVLTRNTRRNALLTLEVTGLLPFFEVDDILGRDEAEPKPSPSGVARLLSRWGCDPSRAVMAGDYLFDLQAGRAAGVATVYVDGSGVFPFGELADIQVVSLDQLLPLFETPN